MSNSRFHPGALVSMVYLKNSRSIIGSDLELQPNPLIGFDFHQHHIWLVSCFSKVTSTTSKVIRKLEPNEVVMLLSVPCKDSDIDVMRVSGHLETEGS